MSGDPLMMSRRVALRGAAADGVAAALTARQGVAAVRLCRDGRTVEVTYDLRHLRFEDVEAVIGGAGGRPATGLFQTLRRGWTRFTEENLLASVSAPVSPCCNRPPDPKAGRSPRPEG